MAGDLITLPLRLWLRSAQLVTRVAFGATERALSLVGHAIQAATPGGPDGTTSYASTRPSGPADERNFRPQAHPDFDQPAEEDFDQPAEEDFDQPAEEDFDQPAEEEFDRADEQDETRAVAAAEDEHPPTARAEPPSDPRRELIDDRVPSPEASVERPPPPREEPAAPTGEAPPTEEPAHVSEEPELVREEAEPGAEEGAGAGVTVLEPWEGYARMSARDVIVRARQANAAELAAVRLYESSHRRRQTVLAAIDRQLKVVNGSGRPA
jgi:hypothetical protein